MSVKLVKRYSEVEDKILHAIDTITDPVRQTLGPRGGNVIFEDNFGDTRSTNDGVTIAKNINVSDPIEDAVISVIKQSALKTNTQAGDGTSTTILLSSILIKEGLKLINDGLNQRDIVDGYREFSASMQKSLEKMKKDVKTDRDLFNITKISANNDAVVAEHAVKIVRAAGEDGYIFLEPSNKKETEVVQESGFIIEAGLLSPDLVNQQSGTAAYEDVPVLITDKRLYYAQEAEAILNTVLNAGYKSVVVIAKDFIGEALPFFIANHSQKNVNVMLIKEPNVDQDQGAALTDLAAYLDGEVLSDSAGKIADRLEIDKFCLARRAYADAKQTVLMRYDEDDDTQLKKRVKFLKDELKKITDDDSGDKVVLKKRLASLTNGIVTVKIGGSTPIEVSENRFRFEDAISAGRAAVKDGYLLGGGVSVFRAQESIKYPQSVHKDLIRVFQKVGEANIRQITENAGVHSDTVISTLRTTGKDVGFDALSLGYVDMGEAGIIDPFKVTSMAIENAVSIAIALVGSRYLIVQDTEDGKSNKTD